MKPNTEATIASVIALSGPLLLAITFAIAYGLIREPNDFGIVMLPVAVYLVMYLVSLPASIWAWSASSTIDQKKRRIHRGIAAVVWIAVATPVLTGIVQWIF